MEALTAVAVAALTIYDMVKAVDKAMVIGDIRLVKKTGGRSGTGVADEMNVLVAIYSPFRAWNIPDAHVERLRREFPGHTFVRADTPTPTLAAIPDVDVAFSSRITPAHLAAARRLRWIHSPAAGVGNMLFPEMIACAIVMTNSRGNSSVTIAEHMIAVTLALLRSLPLAWRRQSERIWAQDEINSTGPITTLRGRGSLIVGLGSIGRETARLASAFGAHVVGIRRRTRSTAPAGVGRVVTPPRCTTSCRSPTSSSWRRPDTPETTHLIGERELALMKEDAVLVNVSRGKLVDEAALVSALEARPAARRRARRLRARAPCS